MKRSLVLFSLAAILLGVSSVARADLNSFLKNVNIQATANMQDFTLRLSKQFGVSEPEVQLIVRSVSQPADAFMVLQVGKMANVEPREVLQKYQSSKSKGWGTVAREVGIKPGSREFHALKRGDLSFPDGRRNGKKGRDDGDSRHGHGNDHKKGNKKD